MYKEKRNTKHKSQQSITLIFNFVVSTFVLKPIFAIKNISRQILVFYIFVFILSRIIDASNTHLLLAPVVIFYSDECVSELTGKMEMEYLVDARQMHLSLYNLHTLTIEKYSEEVCTIIIIEYFFTNVQLILILSNIANSLFIYLNLPVVRVVIFDTNFCAPKNGKWKLDFM